MPDPTRVLIVDDHAIVRDGLVMLLGTQPDIEVVATATDGASALEAASEYQPDVVVLDVGLPDAPGYLAIAGIREGAPTCRVLMLTMSDDAATISACLRAGASGYVLKESGGKDLIAAIRATATGQLVVGAGARAAVSTLLGQEPLARFRDYADLTNREFEVLRLLAEGASVESTAAQLSLSEKTVRNTVSHILAKLRLPTRDAAVQHARAHGLGVGLGP